VTSNLTTVEQLRAACATLRRSPMPISDVIPLLQVAADKLEQVAGPLAAFLEDRVHACEPCSGRGAIPERWLAWRMRGKKNWHVRIKPSDVGIVWHDCKACKQFRDLAKVCRGITL
jgi:hypothetical protein